MEETIAGGWEAYERDIKPTDAERERLREAFYSGAFAGHILTLAACVTEDEALAEAQVKAISEELVPLFPRAPEQP